MSGKPKTNQLTISGLVEQICFLAIQTLQMPKGYRIQAKEEITQVDFGKKRRLYSEINLKPSGKIFSIEKADHKFPIKTVFFSEKSTLHNIQVDGTTHSIKGGVINIESMDFELERIDSNGTKYKAYMKQEATIDIISGEITFKLSEPKSKLLYISKYKINDLYTSDAKISLNPYTDKEEKIIKNNKRAKSIFSKLVGPTVNIYSYLNNKEPYGGQISRESSLADIKGKFKRLSSDTYERLKRQKRDNVITKEDNDVLDIYNFIDGVLASEDTLNEFNYKLTLWWKQYNKWTNRPDKITVDPERQQYMFDFTNTGKPRVSNYISNLLKRTSTYDTKIKFEEDTEIIVDYTKLDEATNLKRMALAKYEDWKTWAKSSQLQEVKEQSEITVKDRMKVTVPITSVPVPETFGIYSPYLVSDILRYGSSFLKSDIITALCLTSFNIETFCKQINGFKSLVFNIASLYHQLSLHKMKTKCLNPTANDETTGAIIIKDFSYSASLYSKLSWHSLEGLVEKSIEHSMKFLPCAFESGSLQILATLKSDTENLSVPFKLLAVDEPIYGDNQFDNLLDFDLLYMDQLKAKVEPDLKLKIEAESKLKIEAGPKPKDDTTFAQIGNTLASIFIGTESDVKTGTENTDANVTSQIVSKSSNTDLVVKPIYGDAVVVKSLKENTNLDSELVATFKIFIEERYQIIEDLSKPDGSGDIDLNDDMLFPSLNPNAVVTYNKDQDSKKWGDRPMVLQILDGPIDSESTTVQPFIPTIVNKPSTIINKPSTIIDQKPSIIDQKPIELTEVQPTKPTNTDDDDVWVSVDKPKKERKPKEEKPKEEKPKEEVIKTYVENDRMKQPRRHNVEYDQYGDVFDPSNFKAPETYIINKPKTVDGTAKIVPLTNNDLIADNQDKEATYVKDSRDKYKETKTAFKERTDKNKEIAELKSLGYKNLEDKEAKDREISLQALVNEIITKWEKEARKSKRSRSANYLETNSAGEISEIVGTMYDKNLLQLKKLTLLELENRVLAKNTKFNVTEEKTFEMPETEGEVYKVMKKALDTDREDRIIKSTLIESDRDAALMNFDKWLKNKEDNNQGGGYYKKYLKYKTKYLELKAKL